MSEEAGGRRGENTQQPFVGVNRINAADVRRHAAGEIPAPGPDIGDDLLRPETQSRDDPAGRRHAARAGPSEPGDASFNLGLQRDFPIAEPLDCQFIVEAFNLFNRTNVRAVNPNFQRAGEPLSAFDPRQIQLALRLRF